MAGSVNKEIECEILYEIISNAPTPLRCYHAIFSNSEYRLYNEVRLTIHTRTTMVPSVHQNAIVMAPVTS